MDIVFAKSIALLLGWVFLRAGWHKMRRPGRFGAIIDNYGLLPFRPGALFAAGLGAAELVTGAGLLFTASLQLSAAAALVLLLTYAGGMGVMLARGRTDVDCGCAGPARTQWVSTPLVVRNLLLAVLAGTLILGGEPRVPGWLDWFSIVCAGASLVMLYEGAGNLLGNRQKLLQAGH